MNRIVIKSIKAINFKGFSNLEVDFTTNAVILGGMNGFGKTTIFDALEILITGQIKRMASYSYNLHNHKYARSQTNVPLVYDMNKDEVRIEATITTDDVEVTLCRFAKVREMKNPVDFTPFNQLYKFDVEKNEYYPTNEKTIESLGINHLIRDYCFLNYISQEEATSFIKCKETDRSSVVQELFDTELFDVPIKKIKTLTQIISKEIDNLNQSYDRLQKDILQLRADVINEGDSSQLYVKLTTDESKWDLENPELTHEEMYSFVNNGGVMDGLMYLCKNEKWFRQNNRNEAINKLLSGESIHNIAFYTWLLPKEGIIKQFSEWFLINNRINSITMGNMENIIYQIEKSVPDIIHSEILAEAKRLVESFKIVYQSATQINKIATDLLAARTTLSEKTMLYGNDLHLRECPLCGAEYTDTGALSVRIESYKKNIENSLTDLDNGLSVQYESTKKYIVEHIQIPVNEYFKVKEITESVLSEYKSLDVNLVRSNIKLLDKLGLKINSQTAIAVIESDIRSELIAQLQEVPADLDMVLLKKIYVSYYDVLDKNAFTIENIQKKKEYLIHYWNLSTSEMLGSKMKEQKSIDNRIGLLKDKKDRIKKLSKEINTKRNQYVSNIITDIQILFYIYTGRILQDSYFGRGLYLKPDFSKNRILIVSGDYENNDVDALYNMSSGQLVAVAISFLLSLNKLYSSNNLLTIDDPVQTIDDINLWGLMETLRHDFNNHFIMLSTHESNYGQLVDYKFKKIGIKSEYIDVARFHNDNNKKNISTNMENPIDNDN